MKIRESSATTLKSCEVVVKTGSTALPYINSVCVGRLRMADFEKELELGVRLINRLTSEEFHAELGMLDQKSKGKQIVIDKAPSPKHSQVIDIMEALKRSMKRVPAKKKTTARAAKKRKNVS